MLGHLLAVTGVRYVVLPVTPLDSSLLSALGRQVDLTQVGIDPSYAVYSNSAWLPVFFALHPGAEAERLAAVAGAPSPLAAAAGAQLVQAVYLHLDEARAGDVVYGAVPPGTWGLDAGHGKVAGMTGALGTTLWHLQRGQQGVVSASPAGGAGDNVAALATLGLWAAGAGVAVRRRKRQPVPAPAGTEPLEARELVLVGAGEPT